MDADGLKVSLAYSLMGNPPGVAECSYRNQTFHRVMFVDASVVTAPGIAQCLGSNTHVIVSLSTGFRPRKQA